MDEYMTVTLTLDNDEVVECAVLTIFSANGQDYIALLPLDEKENPRTAMYICTATSKTIRKDPELENIEDDDEYEAVADAFDEWMDTQDFEDLDEE